VIWTLKASVGQSNKIIHCGAESFDFGAQCNNFETKFLQTLWFLIRCPNGESH